MIEIAGSIVAFIFCILFIIGYNEEKRKLEAFCHSKGWELSDDAEADLYAAYTYQETGEPSAFMLFDHEEPVHIPQVVQTPKPKPRRKPVVSDDSQRIKDLERQLAQLQKVVKTQQQKPVKKTPKVHPLQQDCVDALMAIGYNKTEAKKIVKSHLTDSITSTQDFLMIAMAR